MTLKSIFSAGEYDALRIRKDILDKIIVKRFKNLEEYNKYIDENREKYQHIDPYGEDDWEN